jgi:hypothetical protein
MDPQQWIALDRASSIAGPVDVLFAPRGEAGAKPPGRDLEGEAERLELSDCAVCEASSSTPIY